MFKNITDITRLECLNNMHLDLVAAGKANANDKELVADITEALRKILKNKKINLLSAGILYRYVDGCIEAFSLTKYLAPQDVATELFSEWHHIKYWIENHYTVNNSNK